MSLEIVLTNIQLLLARPEVADLRKIRHYAVERGAEVEEVSYIVKLYTQTPPVYNCMWATSRYANILNLRTASTSR
jgi:hypothetical protein